MARGKVSAADFVEAHDDEMRIILGELVENAGKLNRLWETARRVVRKDPDYALTLLVEAEILLGIDVRIERTDSLQRIRSATRRLDKELPDD
jgi:hypothetical protein